MFSWLNCLQNVDTTRSIFAARHLQCLMLFCGLAVSYGVRVNFSMAIVAMTDQNATNSNFEIYNWDERIKSYLLSSFFWGYVITQIPGGYFAHIYGAKIPLFFGVFSSSLLAALTPICAHIGNWQLVLALRALQGLCQGMIFPSTHTFISKWSPINERAALVTFVYSGTHFGSVLMLSTSGYIAASATLGWPWIFYISGTAGLLWSLIWLRWSASTPDIHRNITITERQLILADREAHNNPAPSPPWLQIVTSLPFLTLIIVHCCNTFGFWTLLIEMPTYMKNILSIDIRSNGPLSALPYFALCLLSYFFIFIAGMINRRAWMSLNFSRKFFNTIGQWLPMSALIGLCYLTAESDKISAIALLTIAVATNAATYLGVQVNHIDLSSNFAGTLMGITNCFGNLMGIIAPLLVGRIVTDEKNPAQWRIIFFIASSLYFIGSILFIILGSTKTQQWNFPMTVSGSASGSTAEIITNDENNIESTRDCIEDS